MNFFLLDKTFGWHGRRTGLALYYIDEQHFQDENHELSLTSNMRSFFQIMATHTKLLGRHVSRRKQNFRLGPLEFNPPF